jgi:hypothetical protein
MQLLATSELSIETKPERKTGSLLYLSSMSLKVDLMDIKRLIARIEVMRRKTATEQKRLWKKSIEILRFSLGSDSLRKMIKRRSGRRILSTAIIEAKTPILSGIARL